VRGICCPPPARAFVTKIVTEAVAMTAEFARENHSVAKAYLKGWALEPNRV
jgi:hypothetical protein